MRMEEIAGALAYASSDLQAALAEINQCEARVADLRVGVEAAQNKINGLLEVQLKLINANLWTEFGLPSGLLRADFEKITGHVITS